MFVLKPDQYLIPEYKISPFRTTDISFNHKIPDDNFADEYFMQRFGAGRYYYTLNGREALSMALINYNLKRNDIVTILTTTGNFYISSCVTNEIKKFCNWSRKIERKTKVILVNHEFGFPFKELHELKKYNLPIIEDCAHSFFLSEIFPEIGTISDFIIYSFPKMFPLQIGGMLVSNLTNSVAIECTIDKMELRYIKNNLSFYVKSEEDIIKRRILNYNYLKDKFELLGLKERFPLEPGTVPGVFMFIAEQQYIDLPELKKYFYEHGIQCSVFYGEEAFFIPVHQALNEQDLDYFFEVMKAYIKKYSV